GRLFAQASDQRLHINLARARDAKTFHRRQQGPHEVRGMVVQRVLQPCRDRRVHRERRRWLPGGHVGLEELKPEIGVRTGSLQSLTNPARTAVPGRQGWSGMIADPVWLLKGNDATWPHLCR